MKVLFIGGTGIISSACSELAIAKGIDLYHLNRGRTNSLRPISGVKNIITDVRDTKATEKALKNEQFDVVVDWISFTEEHLTNSIQLFSGKTDQFIFISTASAYQTPPNELPVTEKTPLDNPYWQYSRDKIACEKLLKRAHDEQGLNYTIVRPSHTYDKTTIPLIGGYTSLRRLMEEKEIIVHGDGASIWTLTHHKDFAVGFVGLFSNPNAMNTDVHITSDEWLTWNQIYELFANELNVEFRPVYIPSEIIARYDSEIGDGLLGDKTHSMIFDNSKIKSLVPEFNAKTPFNEGVKEIVNWHNENANIPNFDPKLDAVMQKLIDDFRGCFS